MSGVTRSSVPFVPPARLRNRLLPLLILAGALVPGCASALIEDHLLPPSTEAPADGSVEVTFLGTTTLLFDDGQTRLLIDGFLTRPSLLQFTTSEIQTDTAVVDAALLKAGIGSLDAIFVAHSHYDLLFLGTGGLGHRIPAMRRQYYDETVGKVGPELVIPIHWDEVFEPLSDELEAGAGTTAAFDFLIERLSDDGIEFGILQGYQSVLLFDT